MRSYIDMNPEFEYHWFDDDDMDRFVERFFPEYESDYRRLYSGAARADLFRYMVIQQWGGIYFDMDTKSRYPFREWGDSKRPFYSVEMITGTGGAPWFGPHQWGLLLRPKHPLMDLVIAMSVKNIRDYFAHNSSLPVQADFITGPHVLNSAFKQLFGDKPPNNDSKLFRYPGEFFSDHIHFKTEAVERERNASKYWTNLPMFVTAEPRA